MWLIIKKIAKNLLFLSFLVLFVLVIINSFTFQGTLFALLVIALLYGIYIINTMY